MTSERLSPMSAQQPGFIVVMYALEAIHIEKTKEPTARSLAS